MSYGLFIDCFFPGQFFRLRTAFTSKMLRPAETCNKDINNIALYSAFFSPKLLQLAALAQRIT